MSWPNRSRVSDRPLTEARIGPPFANASRRTNGEGTGRRRSGEGREPGLSRIEAFSDGVFAIAITLLSLNIVVPQARDATNFVHQLESQWPVYLSFFISFVLIGVIWINHHVMFSYMVRADHGLLWLNLLLLLNVAVLPFTTALVGDNLLRPGLDRIAGLVYGGWLTLGGVLFNGLWAYASTGRRLVDTQLTDGELRTVSTFWIGGPLLYLAATLLALISPRLSLGAFCLLIVLYALPIGPGRVRRPRHREQ